MFLHFIIHKNIYKQLIEIPLDHFVFYLQSHLKKQYKIVLLGCRGTKKNTENKNTFSVLLIHNTVQHYFVTSLYV